MTEDGRYRIIEKKMIVYVNILTRTLLKMSIIYSLRLLLVYEAIKSVCLILTTEQKDIFN